MPNFYNEMYSTVDTVRPHYDAFAQWLGSRDRARVAQPRAFLFQIARNLLRDHWRRQQVRGGTEPAPVEHDEALFEHAAPGPQDKAEQHQRLHHLARALDDLPPRMADEIPDADDTGGGAHGDL